MQRSLAPQGFVNVAVLAVGDGSPALDWAPPEARGVPSLEGAGPVALGRDGLRASGLSQVPSALRSQQRRTRNGVVLKWLRDEEARDPNKITVIVDKDNVVFGGCSEKRLMHAYHSIVKASSNAKIVAGADVSCQPPFLAGHYHNRSLEERRLAVLHELGMKADWAAKWANCSGEGSCSDDPPLYRYLNYGFLMGPVQDLKRLVAEVYRRGGSDQLRASEYALEHPEEVTLDYSGVLTMTLDNVAQDDEHAPVSVANNWMGGKKILRNRITGQVQCFAHGSGKSFSLVRQLASALGPGQALPM